MDRDPRGTISQQGNVMRIDNAFVEEVVLSLIHILIGAIL